MKPIEWTGCYQDQWKGVITDASFVHPAKFAKGLIERILDHLNKRGWIQKGDIIGDPFGGVATGGIVAAYRGYKWIGVELEPKFVLLGNENIGKHAFKLGRLNHPLPLLFQGDSCHFDHLIDAIVSSPPYVSGGHHTDVMDAGNKNGRGQCSVDYEYLGFLSAAPPERSIVLQCDKCKVRWTGCQDAAECPRCGDVKAWQEHMDAIITSPPYAGSLDDGGPEKAHPDGYKRSNNWTGYGKTDGQIATLKEGQIDAVVASPPFLGTRETRKAGGISRRGYEGKEPARPSHKRIGERTYASGQQERADGNIEQLSEGHVDAIISSPPYETIRAGGGGLNHLPAKRPGQQTGRAKGPSQEVRPDQKSYGDTPGQIANTEKASLDAILTSPPYADSVNSKSHGIDFSKAKKDYPGRVHHPERVKTREDYAKELIYGETEGQIGREAGETYWQAVAKVYQACYTSLRPGGVIALVVKDFVKDHKRMCLCDDTMRLLEWIGFEPIERIHAMLTEDQVEHDLFDGTRTKRTERKSFFRRLHESKLAADDPRRIDYEEVLICRKPYDHQENSQTAQATQTRRGKVFFATGKAWTPLREKNHTPEVADGRRRKLSGLHPKTRASHKTQTARKSGANPKAVKPVD